MKKEKQYLILFSTLCILFSLLRWHFTGSLFLLFLVWNLFLAALPWLITRKMERISHWKKNKWIFAVYFTLWLLIFPNSPYIMTDLFHLQHSTAMPQWFDLIMLLFYSWTGLMFGFLSLLKMEKYFALLNIKWTSIHSSFMFVLVSFGIYLGRYLRWNSWDALHNPLEILNDVFQILTHPRQHIDAWGMTLAMTLLLNSIYWSIKLFKNEMRAEKIKT